MKKNPNLTTDIFSFVDPDEFMSRHDTIKHAGDDTSKPLYSGRKAGRSPLAMHNVWAAGDDQACRTGALASMAPSPHRANMMQIVHEKFLPGDACA